MIRFLRDGNKVKINIEHGIFHSDSYFPLSIEQSADYQAELLRAALQTNLNRHLELMKQKYYNEGWKDAKAKTKKRTSFWGGWEK